MKAFVFVPGASGEDVKIIAAAAIKAKHNPAIRTKAFSAILSGRK